MAILLIILLGFGIPALTVFGVWFMGREYDRHPWVRKFLDSEAALYFPPYHGSDDAALPKEYTDQVPGGWDDRP